MESAELKGKSKVKTKRVKHCFRRAELYHQWIHDDNYVYSNQTYKVSGRYDLLFNGIIEGNLTRQELIKYWVGWRRESCLAIINRDKKLILVSTRYKLQSSELLRAIPDDYQVFLTDDIIPNPDILSTGEIDDVVRIHAKWLITSFVEHQLYEAYLTLLGYTNILHVDPTTLFEYDYDEYNYNYSPYFVKYTHIVDFVSKYKIKKYDWYKMPFKGKAWVECRTSWSNKSHAYVDIPSVKQVVTNHVFNAKEKIKLAQSYFYGKYCYSYGISRKEVSDKWKAPYNRETFEALFKKHNIEINLDNRPNLLLWTDGIKLYHKALVAKHEEYIAKCYEKSKQNEREAYAKLDKKYNSAALEAFRTFMPYNEEKRIPYNRYYRSYRKNSLGTWKTIYIYIYNSFANTQLRLKNDVIETSRHAKVPLTAAIAMWKLYKRIADKHDCAENTDYIVRFDNKNIKVGIYNLRAIMYRKKKTDQGKVLDKYEWCVVIGCHYLWIDDFMDFVKYYNLYDKFGIIKPVLIDNSVKF